MSSLLKMIVKLEKQNIRIKDKIQEWDNWQNNLKAPYHSFIDLWGEDGGCIMSSPSMCEA